MDVLSYMMGAKSGGGSSTTIEALSVTQNGTTTAPAGTAYSPVTVNVPNSYTASDEGKVVSNGALVAQTAHATVTQNGTIDTTLNNSVEVAVSADPNPTAEENDVNFIDYDGTIRYSYSAADFANLTELPANPTHQGLTAQGWNWTLADAKTHVATYKALWIGQMYITDDGKTRIYVELGEGRLSPMLGCCPDGSVTVDWGDGSATDVLSGTSKTTPKFTPHHYYAKAGKYVITITVNNGQCQLYGSSSTNQYGYTLRNSTGADVTNRLYQNAILRVEIGSNMFLGSDAFYYCSALKSITIPKNCQVGSEALRECPSLVSLTIPSTNAGLPTYMLAGNRAAKNVSIPNGVDQASGQLLSGAHSVSQITLPNTVTLINNNAFMNAIGLSSFILPSGVTQINSFAFQYCTCGEFRFCPTTAPSVQSSNTFSNMATDCTFYVPYSALAAYLTGTNYPSPSTYTYLGFATYASGATLPTQDTTAAYNVTWYATKADALAGTNPITQGNGNEVYCTYAAV